VGLDDELDAIEPEALVRVDLVVTDPEVERREREEEERDSEVFGEGRGDA